MAAEENLMKIVLFSVINDVSDDDSDDGESMDVTEDALLLFAAAMALYRRPYMPKIELFYENLVPMFSDEDFRYHFRLSRASFNLLMRKFGALIEGDAVYRGGFEHIKPDKQLAIHVWYLANQSSMRQVALKFGHSKAMIHKIVHKISWILCDNASKLIRWPDERRRASISEGFGDQLPNIVGVVDGTHIEIINPSKDNSYMNRKKYASVQVQLISDDMLLINDIYAGFPGSAHDARVFRNSDIFEKGENGEACSENEYIIADSAYPCKNWVIPPFKDNGRLTQAQKRFNRILSSKRQSVERCIGLLKGRMRKLICLPFTDQTENRAQLMTNIVRFIVSAAVIHNCCILANDDLEDFIDMEVVRHGDMGQVNDGRGQVLRDDGRRQHLLNSLT